MTLNRRGFLASVGWSFFASAAARGEAPKPAAAAGAENFSDWSQVRTQFDLSPEWLHFSQFYIVSHPRPVREAIERYRRMLDANPFATVEHGMGFAAFLGQQSQDVAFPVRVQQAAAQYLGGRPDEVALTDSTTTGLALIYNGLTLTPGDEILTTTHDHYVHHEAIRLAAPASSGRRRRTGRCCARRSRASTVPSRLRPGRMAILRRLRPARPGSLRAASRPTSTSGRWPKRSSSTAASDERASPRASRLSTRSASRPWQPSPG